MARTALFAILLFVTSSTHASLFLNVYGTAKHGENSDRYNESNYGFGFRSASGSILYEGGVFRDSRNNLSKYAGGGYVYGFRYVGVGAGAFLMSRPNYRDGEVFLGALPIMTLNAGSVVTTVTYIPAFERTPATFFVYWSLNPFMSN